MPLTLYNNAYSTCSQKVRLCLAEKRLAWTDRQISFRDREHIAPDYLKLNPNGVVPTLVHDGEPVIDSSVIMEYLDDIAPECSLTPADPLGRARLRAWMRYFEEVPTVAVRYPSFNRVFVRHFAELDERALDKEATDRPLRKHFYKRMGKHGFPEHEVAAALDNFRSAAQRMEGALADGRPWILGAQLTIADCCVAPLYDRMEDLGHVSLWADQPRVLEWFARFKARPSYPETFYPGTRLSDLYEDLRPAEAC